MRPFALLALGLTLAACTQQGPAPVQNGTLEFAAGTSNVQNGPSSSGTPGTAFLVRYLDANGNPPAQDVQLTITGPAGWNGGAPLTYTQRANTPRFWGYKNSVAAVSGVYRVTATVNGTALQKDSVPVNAASTLDYPRNITIAATSPGNFAVLWSAVPGAAVYLVRVIEVIEDAPDVSLPGAYTYGTTAAFQEANYEFGKTYRPYVIAFNANVGSNVVGNLTLPAQFNVGVGLAPATFNRTQ